MSDASSDTILSVQNLGVSFGRGRAAVTALRDVSFSLERGRTLRSEEHTSELQSHS